MPKPPSEDKRAKISPEQREEIVRRRAAGEGLAALAAEYGISRQRVDVIAKRQKPASKKQPRLTPLSPDQLDWLQSRLAQSKRSWKLAAVEKLVHKTFGIHMQSATHMTWLVERGVSIAGHDDKIPLTPEFEAYLRSEQARKLREKEALWKASLTPYKPRLGRPRKNPLPPPAPAPPPPLPKAVTCLDDDDFDFDADLEDSDDDSPIECLSLEEMRASVEATRKKLAAAGRPAPPISAWGQQPRVNALGQRLGKHAKASQPPKKKKKRKKR